MTKCKICSEEFIPVGRNRSFCPKTHMRDCDYCGTEYMVKKVSKPPKFCSGSCSAKARNEKKGEKKICQYCGDSFTSTNGNAKFCSKTHMKKCENCGTEFIIENMSRIKKFCSRDCTMKSKTFSKQCKLCGDVFETHDNKILYCSNTHFKNCENCGKSFEINDPRRKVRFCSISCASSAVSFDLVCELCGKDFTSGRKDTKICFDSHTLECAVCHNEFETDKRHLIPKTCSKTCASRLIDYDERKKKSEKSISKRFGRDFTNASQVNSVKEKKKETLLENYGVDNPSKSEEIKQKRILTNMERYGVSNAGVSAQSLEKIKKTNQKKYGVDNVFQSEEVKKKIRETLSEKHGKSVLNPMQILEIKEKARKTTFERFGVESVLSLPEIQKLSVESNGRRFSSVNKKWKEKIERELNVECEIEESFAKGFYSDLSIGNVHIDINPTFTHNSSVSFVHGTGRCVIEDCSNVKHLPRSKSYHHERALAAEQNGKILLQYFDWFNEDIFLSIIRSKLHLDENKVYAKKCEIREISQRDANVFLKENHLLGAAKKQTFCVGLFYKDELVHVNTYGPSRLNKNFEWEAIRSCSKKNFHVQGGLQRCDAFFKKFKKPSSIISYIDLAISNGDTEAKNPGWKLLTVNKASSTWAYCGLSEDLGKRPVFVKGNTARMLSADRLLGLEIGKKYPLLNPDGSKFSNDQVLLSEGYLDVWDAGTKTYCWKKEDSE